MQTYVWIGLTMVAGGLALWGWRYHHRRAWPTSKKDEAMRRHVNKAYD
jgi:high-affinity Fe2+/Pb2+ permease